MSTSGRSWRRSARGPELDDRLEQDVARQLGRVGRDRRRGPGRGAGRLRGLASAGGRGRAGGRQDEGAGSEVGHGRDVAHFLKGRVGMPDPIVRRRGTQPRRTGWPRAGRPSLRPPGPIDLDARTGPTEGRIARQIQDGVLPPPITSLGSSGPTGRSRPFAAGSRESRRSDDFARCDAPRGGDRDGLRWQGPRRRPALPPPRRRRRRPAPLPAARSSPGCPAAPAWAARRPRRRAPVRQRQEPGRLLRPRRPRRHRRHEDRLADRRPPAARRSTCPAGRPRSATTSCRATSTGSRCPRSRAGRP